MPAEAGDAGRRRRAARAAWALAVRAGLPWARRATDAPTVLRDGTSHQNLFPLSPGFPGWKGAKMAETAPREHRGGSIRGLLIRWSRVRVPTASLAQPLDFQGVASLLGLAFRHGSEMGTGTSPASISCGLIATGLGASPRF